MAGYGDWVRNMKAKLSNGDRSDPAVQAMDKETSAGEMPFHSVEFARTERSKYLGEIGRKGADFIYHFFPIGKEFPENFGDALGDAFLEVFKFSDRIFADFVPEMNSWAIKVQGYGKNIVADDLAIKVFDILDAKLG